VHRLLGIKPIYSFTSYAWIAFFYLTFWTTLAPFVLFLQIPFWKVFSESFANSQRYMNRLHEAFSTFEISPPVSKAFPLTNQNSPCLKFSS
jgi:hypothetical protein